MGLFGKKKSEYPKMPQGDYVPVLRCSICTGEQVAGFRDNATGKFTDVMLIRSSHDLDTFRKKYGIEGDIEKIY